MKNIKSLKLIFFNISFYFVFFLYSAIAIPVLTLLVAYFSLFMSHRNSMKWFRRAISWYGMVAIKVLPFPLIRIYYKDYEKNHGTAESTIKIMKKTMVQGLIFSFVIIDLPQILF